MEQPPAGGAELNAPMSPESMPPSSVTQNNRSPNKTFLYLFGALIILALVVLGAYSEGYDRGKSQKKQVSAAQASAETLKVPAGATIIAQCAKGRGTQYVLPKDIPHGPVYNVYQGKVIGLEYMIGKDDLADNKSFLSLPLFNTNYDHIDVGLLSQGHAGYPEPHYHVDLYNVTPAQSAAITCAQS